ncbi:MAG: hypothetical protein Q8P16_01975 [bacterium]|nr:hypothetical protein [bacterium]
MEEPKRSPWAPPETDDFVKLDNERLGKQALNSIRKEIRLFNKKEGILCEIDEEIDLIDFTCIEGNIETLRARLANIVGRTNEELSKQNAQRSILYENADGGSNTIRIKLVRL